VPSSKRKRNPIQLPMSVKALWDERQLPSRGPKPALSADQIARAAIVIADAEGLDAVSMQRIAREVNVTTMALYRYFSSKEELIDRMIDSAGGPLPTRISGARGWRQRLAEWTRGCSSIYRDHPWFLQAATARRRVMGPNELEWFDAALSALRDAGLVGSEQMGAFHVLIGHVRSQAEFHAKEAKGLSADQWVRVTVELAAKHPERYPALMSAIESGGFTPPTSDGVGFGLKCILDGIESLARKRRKRKPSAPSQSGRSGR
jgi:AcrR family transcriptional regulator